MGGDGEYHYSGMLDSVNAVSEEPGAGEESDRIDALLSSALADQARERRMLVETVFGAKTALVKAEEELAEVRALINKRDDALMEAIARNNDALVARIEEAVKDQSNAGLVARIEAIEEAILQLAQRFTELPGQLRRDLEVSAVAIGDRIGEESASLLADIREDTVEVVQTLAAMSEAGARDLKQALELVKQEMGERVTATGRDSIEAGRSHVEQMVEHLTGYLHERDEQLYRARDQRLIDLFQQLSDTLGRSTKRKVGKIMAEENVKPQPSAPPMPPVKPPPPLSLPKTFRQPDPQRTQAIRTPFPPDPAAPQGLQDLEPPGPFDRPDPAFAFDPPVRAFDLSPEELEGSDSPRGRQDPFGRLEPPVRNPEPPLNQPTANPLTRAELARDYLIDPPDLFVERPPTPGRGRRKPQPGRGDEPPAKARSGPRTGGTPKPPPGPRTRRRP